MTDSAEMRWTDLPPKERARRLRAPIVVQHIGSTRSWGGASINENRHTQNERQMPRDQWYEPWRGPQGE